MLWRKARSWIAKLLFKLRNKLKVKLKVVTPLGWFVLASAIGAATLGFTQDWLEFRVLALVAALLLLLAIAWLLGSRAVAAQLLLDQQRVSAGQEGGGEVRLLGTGGVTAARSALLELPVGEQLARFRVTGLRTDAAYVERFVVPTERRGVINIGPVRQVRTDPLGVLTRERDITAGQELFVHPQVKVLGTDAVGYLRDVEGVTTAKLSSSDVTFHTLREYQPGDDRRAIHWRTTARTGKLMVRQFEETMRAHLLILLSTQRADYADPEDFELAVSAAGSLGVSAFGQERQVSIWTSAGELAFASAMTMLDALSRVELSGSGYSVHLGPADNSGHSGNAQMALTDMAVSASAAESGISVAALVSGSVDMDALRAASLAIPAGVRSFAVRCGAGLKLQRTTYGELAVLDLPRLDDLPAAMRSVQ